MRHCKLPNFFVVGAGKAGTTSLYGYLKQHPQIYMSPVKEPSHFASEVRAANLSQDFTRHVKRQYPALRRLFGDDAPLDPLAWLVPDWNDYLRLFRDVTDEKAIGEATPSYLWSETAAANIRSRIPGARIVMILRDPSKRAFSHYLHQLSEGLTRCAFREHIERCARGGHGKIGVYYPFLEVGLYSSQVKRYLDLFPRQDIRIYWYEEAWAQPARMLADLYGFLGVDTGFLPDMTQRALERRSPRLAAVNYLLKKFDVLQPLKQRVPDALRPGLRRLSFRRGNTLMMDPRDRRYLVAYYREDILRLASLLDRDLSAWLR